MNEWDAAVPAQDLQAEQAVIGAMLRDNGCIAEVLESARREDFYSGRHQALFGAAAGLWLEKKAVDLITLRDRLTADGALETAGGVGYLCEVSDAAPSAAGVLTHVGILKEKRARRDLAGAAREMAVAAADATRDVREGIEEGQKRLYEAASGYLGLSAASDATAVMTEVIGYIDERAKNKGMAGLATGIKGLDAVTGGLQAGEVTIIAARPSVGKTSFALQAAREATKGGEAVAFFSLEMTRRRLGERLVQMASGVSGYKIQRGTCSDAEILAVTKAAGEIAGSKLYIVDRGGMTPVEVRATATRLAGQYGVKLVVIDYLQLMEAGRKAENRNAEIGLISRSVKAMAVDLGVAVMALSQLNRASEERAQRRPRISDLRDSGTLEQDADAVYLLYRPNESDNRSVMAEVAKNRNGGVGDVALWFDGEKCSFVEAGK